MEKVTNLKTKQIQEAVERMKSLKLMKSVIQQFVGEHILYYSEDQGGPFRGILYWVSNEDAYVEEINKFEQKYNAVVYHAILNHTSVGDLLTLLYVSKHEEEWEMDREDISQGIALCYVVNLSNPLFSEFGSVGICPVNGGISRSC